MDSSTSSPSGYPCRDQYGATQAANGSMTAGAFPFLIWGNYTLPGDTRGTFTTLVESDGVYLKDGIDYFSQSSATSSPQTGGVRTGTKATMTALGCSKGFFWVTNEGYWNSTTPGTPSGALYKCTATNTWTAYYVPYPYPHPLQSGLAAPTGLTVK